MRRQMDYTVDRYPPSWWEAQVMRFLWIQSQNHEYIADDFKWRRDFQINRTDPSVQESFTQRAAFYCISQIKFSADGSIQCYFICIHLYGVHMPICEIFTYFIKNFAFILFTPSECIQVGDFRVLSAKYEDTMKSRRWLVVRVDVSFQ